jgi:hypothetical protein
MRPSTTVDLWMVRAERGVMPHRRQRQTTAEVAAEKEKKEKLKTTAERACSR